MENGATTVGAAIAIAQHTTKQNIANLINGGSFKGVKALNEEAIRGRTTLWGVFWFGSSGEDATNDTTIAVRMQRRVVILRARPSPSGWPEA